MPSNSFASVTMTTSTLNMAHKAGRLPEASSAGSVMDVSLSAYTFPHNGNDQPRVLLHTCSALA